LLLLKVEKKYIVFKINLLHLRVSIDSEVEYELHELTSLININLNKTDILIPIINQYFDSSYHIYTLNQE
jgi:hypothetical protein